MTLIIAFMAPMASFGAQTADNGTPAGADFCNSDRVEGEEYEENGKKYKIINGVPVIQN